MEQQSLLLSLMKDSSSIMKPLALKEKWSIKLVNPTLETTFVNGEEFESNHLHLFWSREYSIQDSRSTINL